MSLTDGIYPFSDEDMVYIFATHRYALTPQCVINNLGIDLKTCIDSLFNSNPSAAANQWLIQQSKEIYTYLLEPSSNTPLWELLLAKAPTARQWIKQALLDTVQYFLINGFPSQLSGINIVSGTQIDLTKARESAMQITGVSEIASRRMPEIGVPMRYGGPLNFYMIVNYLQAQGGTY